MINRTVLVGRLTKDPEIRYTQSGVAVVSFTLAVNRQFTNSQGEREAEFIGCTIWRKAAENFANFTKKGSLVGIDGRIQTSSYDNQQGERVYRTDVIVENFSLLEKSLRVKSMILVIPVMGSIIRIRHQIIIRAQIIIIIKEIRIIRTHTVTIVIQIIIMLEIHTQTNLVVPMLVMMICHFKRRSNLWKKRSD